VKKKKGKGSPSWVKLGRFSLKKKDEVRKGGGNEKKIVQAVGRGERAGKGFRQTPGRGGSSNRAVLRGSDKGRDGREKGKKKSSSQTQNNRKGGARGRSVFAEGGGGNGSGRRWTNPESLEKQTGGWEKKLMIGSQSGMMLGRQFEKLDN